MADVMTLENYAGSALELFNVSASVGKNGVNSRSDVFLVQALLREIPDHRRGGISYRDCPIPTGTFNKATSQVIRKYQRCHKRERIARDCLINRAVGLYVPGTLRPWTIIQLNLDLQERHILEGFPGGFMELVMDKYPELSLMLLA